MEDSGGPGPGGGRDRSDSTRSRSDSHSMMPRSRSDSMVSSSRDRSDSTSKFRRRTSGHKLSLDVARARDASLSSNSSGRGLLPPGATQEEEQDAQDALQQLRELHQVREEGKQIFDDFIRREMQRRGMQDRLDMLPAPPQSNSSSKNLMWIKAGRELREMADAFSRSKERERIRQNAYRNTIWGFLSELADWAGMFFWLSKVMTIRLSQEVVESSSAHAQTLTSPATAAAAAQVFTIDYNNNSTI